MPASEPSVTHTPQDSTPSHASKTRRWPSTNAYAGSAPVSGGETGNVPARVPSVRQRRSARGFSGTR